MNLFFLINSLNAGGAERQLTEFVRHIDKRRFSVSVTTFYGHRAFWDAVESTEGVSLACLNKCGRWDVLGFAWRLFLRARKLRPAVMVGLNGGEIFVLLVGRLLGAKVVWSIRRSNIHNRADGRFARLSFRLHSILSRQVDLVLFNSEEGRRCHEQTGYRPRQSLVISNGFDTGRFRLDPKARQAVRREWKVPPDVPLIGIVGRLNQVKDHPTFLRAAAGVAKRFPDAHFICVGEGPEEYLHFLQAQARECRIAERVRWTGRCSDMPRAYVALDILANTSLDEAFPNVVGEAMSCGVPCVVTDVGDSSRLVGDTGLVVPRRDHIAVTCALCDLLARPSDALRELGLRARARIEEQFSIEPMVCHTEDALMALFRDQRVACI